MYLSEKFDPKFYLSHVHQNTSAVELEGAEDALKKDLKVRNDELKKLVKENFDCFISCKNTIDGKCMVLTCSEYPMHRSNQGQKVPHFIM